MEYQYLGRDPDTGLMIVGYGERRLLAQPSGNGILAIGDRVPVIEGNPIAVAFTPSILPSTAVVEPTEREEEFTFAVLTYRDNLVFLQRDVPSGATLTEAGMTTLGDVTGDWDNAGSGSIVEGGALSILGKGQAYSSVVHASNATQNNRGIVFYASNPLIDRLSEQPNPQVGQEILRIFLNQNGMAQIVYSDIGDPTANRTYQWYYGPYVGNITSGTIGSVPFVAPDDAYTDTTFLDPFPGNAIVNNRILLKIQENDPPAIPWDSVYYDVDELPLVTSIVGGNPVFPVNAPVVDNDLADAAFNARYSVWSGQNIYYLDIRPNIPLGFKGYAGGLVATLKHYSVREDGTGTGRGSKYGAEYITPIIPAGHTLAGLVYEYPPDN